MRNKRVKLSCLLFGFGLTTQAQQITNATGGNASGSAGSAAYSVGQILYTTSIGSNGSVAQGVQQPYEIAIVQGLERTSINLELFAYPNPTANSLTLTVGNGELSGLNFQLYDINGKLIESRKITNRTESIGMENLPSASYFLKVSCNNQGLKTFKIIKK